MNFGKTAPIFFLALLALTAPLFAQEAAPDSTENAAPDSTENVAPDTAQTAAKTPLFVKPADEQINPETGLYPRAERNLERGIYLHDQGEYDKAIAEYRKALAVNPDSPLILYEMAFSYMYGGDFQKSLEICQQGIENAEKLGMKQYLPGLYDIKASALDNLGRGDEAIAVYKEAIEKYGTGNSLLYYNLAVAEYRQGKKDEAYQAALNSAELNHNHPGSNFVLGKVCYEQGHKTQALYSLCYFLLLEPHTERAAEAYAILVQLLSRQGEQLGFSDSGSFTAADLMITLIAASNVQENAASAETGETDEYKQDRKAVSGALKKIFPDLEEAKNSGNFERSAGDELWWDFYAPFFDRIAKSEYMDIYCRYIAITADPEAEVWLESDYTAIDGFFDWLNNQ